MRQLTHSENKAWKNFFIKQIASHYGVNMAEAIDSDINAYPSFNHFFTRALKPGVRTVANNTGDIACPADGTVSQAGNITDAISFKLKVKAIPRWIY